jgi:creatinine amidohydrolase
MWSNAKPMSRRVVSLAAVLTIWGVAAPTSVRPVQAQQGGAAAAVPAMRTRLLTSLTGYEVDEYIKRNDVIFVPVGPTEINGGNPTDVEYVIPLAYAMKLAEKGDGLVLPYLAYFYPGGTTTSHATVYMSTSETLPFLKGLTRSLIRQGFRRIVFLTSHGPSGNTMFPLLREIYDEYHVPVGWMDTGAISSAGAAPRTAPGGAPGAGAAGAPQQQGPAQAGPGSRSTVTYGAYQIVGRLEDMPVGLSQPQHAFESNDAQSRTQALLSGAGQPGSGNRVGSWYADPSQHGGWVTPVTAEQRAQWGREGAAMISAQVARYDVAGLLQGLRDHLEWTRKMEQKWGDLLPGQPAPR